MQDSRTKQIPCPEHGGKHEATLYCYPHILAGIWECGELSDTHEHSDYEVETVENWPTGPLDHVYESEIYVCGGKYGCGVTIEDADPAEDRADAIADMQIMQARGK